jgi:hypothetical protein
MSTATRDGPYSALETEFTNGRPFVRGATLFALVASSGLMAAFAECAGD